MDKPARANPAALSDADTPASRPGAKSVIAVIIMAAAIAYFLFGSSLGAHF